MPANNAAPPSLGSYLTVGEAARVLGVSVWTLRYWDRSGKLTSHRHPLNGYRLYRQTDLDALLRQAAVKGRPGPAAGEATR